MINELYETYKPYYLVLGERFLYAKAAYTYTPATLYRKPELDESFLKKAVETKKSILWLRYDTSEENVQCETKKLRIGDFDSWIVSYNIYGNELPDGSRILNPEKAADELMRIIAKCEGNMVDQGVFSGDIQDYCRNCQSIIDIRDRYCRHCGSKRGEGRFEPENNNSFGIYGPSIWRRYQCADCGKTWEGVVFTIFKSSYCPQCGKKYDPILEKPVYDLMEEYLIQNDKSDTTNK